MAWPELSPLFQFSTHPLELVVRGTSVYWFLFLLLRFILHRGAGSIGIADILLLVLIADASQNAMAGDYKTLADGALVVGTIAGWNWIVDWTAFHHRGVRRWVQPAPVLLVRHGVMQQRNLKRELISENELMARLRENGIEDLSQVKSARLESDGDISVIREPSTRRGGGDADGPPRGHVGTPGAA